MMFVLTLPPLTALKLKELRIILVGKPFPIFLNFFLRTLNILLDCFLLTTILWETIFLLNTTSLF